MGNVVDVEVIDTGLQAKLNALAKAGQSRAMFQLIGSRVADRVRLCFKFSVDPWGNPWAKLKYRRGQPLVKTGRLRSSIASRADNTGVTIGTNVDYAPPHQFGADIQQLARSQSIFRRIRKDGTFARGGRFVKRGVANFESKVTIGAYASGIPPRPFLPIKTPGGPVQLPAAWSASIVRALRVYFKKAVA